MILKYVDIIVGILGGIYLLFCIMLVTNSDIAKYLIFLMRMLLFVITSAYIFKYQKKILWVYFPIFSFYLAYGFINANRINFIYADILSAFILAFIFFFNFANRDYLTKKIIDMLSIIIIIGSITVLYYFSVNGLQAATSLENRLALDDADENFSLKGAFALVQPSLLLLPFIWYVDSKRKLVILIAFTIYFLFSLMIVSRAGIGGSFFALLFAFFIGLKDKYIRFDRKLVGFCIFVSITFSGLFYKYNDEIKALSSFAMMRFAGIEGVFDTETRTKVEKS